MALEKPIITTAMKECKKYKSIFIANNAEEFISFVEAEHSPLIAYEDVFVGEILNEEVKERIKSESHTRLYLCANNILKALESQLNDYEMSQVLKKIGFSK